METTIQFESVSKKYLLGSRRAYFRYLLPDFLKARIDNPAKLPGRGDQSTEELWALKDVTFQVGNGEVLGIVGPNGAGKTTALSLLAGIISPTSGRIALKGRVGALIKLGAGFHPDLTGRENVYLNGSILGLSRSEIDALYDDIVAFAELDKFMDTPVKRYSSGMYVRLGFAVAVHIEPEVLLIDEILSVGDVSFQSKCLNRIGEIREAGATVIFVSHNMHHVASFCTRVMYLNNGQIVRMGDPGEVLAAYTSDVMERRIVDASTDGSDFDTVNGTGRVVIKHIEFMNEAGLTVDRINNNDPVTLRVYYQAEPGIRNPVLDVVIRDASRGNMFQATNREFGIEFGDLGEGGFFDVHFPQIPSNNQVLDFFITLWNSSHTEKFDWKRFVKLQVVGNPTASGRFLFDCDWSMVQGDDFEQMERAPVTGEGSTL